jgi:hypothetical protein
MSAKAFGHHVVRLALQTDSTRTVPALSEVGRAKLDGFTAASHHEVSHHGKDPEKIEQLALIEEAENLPTQPFPDPAPRHERSNT